jgi:hypothetical protein
LLADGSLLAGGYFHEVNGEMRSLVVKLTARGAVNPDFGNDLELEGETAVVTCVVPQADGKVLVGGSFEGINDEPAVGVARLNALGEPDPDFQAGLGVAGGEFPAVESLVRLPDGGLFLGGEFTRFEQGPATNLAMLLGGGGYNFVSTPWGGANSVVFSVSQPASNSLLVGGAFTHIGGAQRLGLARYTVLPDLLISITPDGNRVKLSWDRQATLLEAGRPEGPWKEVPGASSPFFTETTATPRCFRLREP